MHYAVSSMQFPDAGKKVGFCDIHSEMSMPAIHRDPETKISLDDMAFLMSNYDNFDNG